MTRPTVYRLCELLYRRMTPFSIDPVLLGCHDKWKDDIKVQLSKVQLTKEGSYYVKLLANDCPPKSAEGEY